MIVVHAGSVVSSERTRQTLDVLLTTPMAGEELLRQKLWGVRRLRHVLLVPFLTIFFFEFWWFQGSGYRWLCLPLSLATGAVYLPLVTWLALWMGLNVKSQFKAILTTIGLITGWLLLPEIVRALLIDMAGRRVPAWLDCVLALSPSELIAGIEGLVPLALV